MFQRAKIGVTDLKHKASTSCVLITSKRQVSLLIRILCFFVQQKKTVWKSGDQITQLGKTPEK